MPRYKAVEQGPILIGMDLAQQCRPGTFEHALNHLIDHELDLSHFDARYRNELTGPPAYSPAMLLKVVLYAYLRGIIGSSAIADACYTHVVFIALSGYAKPHFAGQYNPDTLSPVRASHVLELVSTTRLQRDVGHQRAKGNPKIHGNSTPAILITSYPFSYLPSPAL